MMGETKQCFSPKMNQDVPIKLLWGTFCRKAIVDRETGEASLIGLLPGIKLAPQSIITKADGASNPALVLNLGSISIYATFEKTGKHVLTEKLEIPLDVELLISNSDKQIVNVLSVLEVGSDFSFVIIALENTVFSVPLVEGSYETTFEAHYKLNDTDLGNIILPVSGEIIFLEEG